MHVSCLRAQGRYQRSASPRPSWLRRRGEFRHSRSGLDHAVRAVLAKTQALMHDVHARAL
jgi:hypothetical protein